MVSLELETVCYLYNKETFINDVTQILCLFAQTLVTPHRDNLVVSFTKSLTLSRTYEAKAQNNLKNRMLHDVLFLTNDGHFATLQYRSSYICNGIGAELLNYKTSHSFTENYGHFSSLQYAKSKCWK